MATKAVFFDWDGTLVDSFALNFKSLNATREHFGMPLVSEEEFRANFATTAHETFTKFFGVNYTEYAEYYYEIKKEIAKEFPFEKLQMPGSSELMDFLREKKASSDLMVGIISNKNEPDLLEQIQDSGWADIFDVAIGSTATRNAKPTPHPLELALASYPGERKPLGREMLYVGDTDTDHQFSQNTGMKFIGIGSEFSVELPPEQHVDTLSQLQGRLEHLLGRGASIGTP